MVQKAKSLLLWRLTSGLAPQSYLGAFWIPWFLRWLPVAARQRWALRLLAASPHYFLDRSADRPLDASLARASEAFSRSREDAYQSVLAPFLTPEMTVLDYGCGPGYLARVTAARVRRVFACDLSRGVLACARILNAASNLTYLPVSGLPVSVRSDRHLSDPHLSDRCLDAVYSLAVVQHLTDRALQAMLARITQKLRPDGLLILHVQLDDPGWRTESDWRADRTLRGRLKYRWGLHCFSRRESEIRDLLRKHGFHSVERRPLRDSRTGRLFPTQALFLARSGSPG